MKIDTEILIEKLMSVAESHSLLVQSPLGNQMVLAPEFDRTASYILRGIAFAISEATVSEEQ